MKKVILAIAVISCLSIQSCKKCWNCGTTIDGSPYKICDKEKKDIYESGYFTDANGNKIYLHCD